MQGSREGLDRIADAATGVKLRRLRRLSIGVYGFFASRVLLPLWRELRAAQPTLEIDLHTSLNPLDLLPGRYDAVIAVSDAEPRPGLVSHALVPIATVPVCAPPGPCAAARCRGPSQRAADTAALRPAIRGALG